MSDAGDEIIVEIKDVRPSTRRRRHDSYHASISLLHTNLIDNEILDESCKNKIVNVLNGHLEMYRATAGQGEEYDHEFILDIASMGKSLRQLSDEVTLEELEEMEHRRNRERSPSRRVCSATVKVNAWHQKNTLKEMYRVSKLNSYMAWLTSVYRCDPRWKIMRYFDEVAREGGNVPSNESSVASPLPDLFSKASVFTVWRPTSDEAIRNMMLGIACGKGLDIKGKSAKKGNISSYVPFIQVFEAPHKHKCKAYVKASHKIRIFYQTADCRNMAYDAICAAMESLDKSEYFTLPDVQNIKHGKNVEMHALDIKESLFWECYVMMQDCSRPANTEWDIGRKSLPPFMEMNLETIRREPGIDEPRAVVYQMSKMNAMEPRTLLMAYEENGRVKPVVSDFDCFILGSRGVRYQLPIPPDQVELLKWSVNNIGQVLDERNSRNAEKMDWVDTWFGVLNKSRGYHPKPPRFGNGDPKSYEIIEVAESRLRDTGCVRHGAECFNWFFPQEIDEEFLVISDTLPGNRKWKKMNVHELQDILIEKIREGFTFPINPKWVLCDPGWKRVYNELLASEHPNVQDSINCWLPPEAGLREQIEEISARHPCGFDMEGVKINKLKSFTRRMIIMRGLEKKTKSLIASHSTVNFFAE